MKRLLTPILLVLALTGCHQAAVAPALNKTNETPGAPKIPIVFTPRTDSPVSPEDVPLLEQINRENVKVLASALPAIVRITASRDIDPRLEIFRRDIPFPFRSQPGARSFPPTDLSYGSGVILSQDGFIVTNEHVVEEAKDIQVELQDKRSLTARVVASDSLVDVAVLKIDATGLTPLPWGDSDKVQVGEQVFAVGNPFKLDDSASKGIISATGRSWPDSPLYENFIQTDAAINPGNSGGALINIHGEMIGINTAIASTSGGNMGVGFAIPSNLARYAVEGLLKAGRLERGYLGVRLPMAVDEGVNESLNLGGKQGALVAGVQPKSPAELAGLHAGDFITEVDGHKVDGIAELRLVVSQLPIGKEVEVHYIRGGAAQLATVKVAELPGIQLTANEDDENPNPSQAAPDQGNVLLGLEVNDLDDKSRQKFNVDDVITSGVIIDSVAQGSPAEGKGLQQGDVIESVAVNRGSTRQLVHARDFTEVAQNLKPDQSVVLLVHHGKASSFIYLSPLPK